MLSAILLVGGLSASGMVQIPEGEFRPLYLSTDTPLVTVETFAMDRLPVTNSQYFEFVMAHPKWQKDRIPGIFADSRYLEHWQPDATENKHIPEPSIADNAVVNVSWFAASAYCKAMGKRLPTVAQWEYAAKASQLSEDGSSDPEYRQRILDWYARHGSVQDIRVGQTPANYWGVQDLHGLVWEWTEDFNNALVSGESRADSSVNQNLYCAAGAVGTADPGDYAAFMRYGFRSSLSARYSLPNLGFRCVSKVDLTNEIN